MPRCAKRGLVLNSAVGGGRLVLNSDLSRSSRGAACRGDWADMDARTSAGCTLPGDIIITTDAGFVATDASRPRCESLAKAQALTRVYDSSFWEPNMGQSHVRSRGISIC